MTTTEAAPMAEGVQHRVYEFRAAAGSDGKSRVEGYASVWGSKNSYDEVFVPGAFTATLAAKSERKPLVMGYNHHPFAPTPPIGVWEIPPSGEDEIGLFLSGPVTGTESGTEAVLLAKNGVLTGLSVGYDPFDLDYVIAPDGAEVVFDTPFGQKRYQHDGFTVYITRCNVLEASLVPYPSDDEARLTAVRSALMEKVRRAMPALRGDEPTWEDTAYSMALLMGGRGASAFEDASDLDHRRVYEHLSAGYTKHGKTPPEYRRSPIYGDVEFQHDERSIFQDIYLRKLLANVRTGLTGLDGPLSEETRSAAIEVADLLTPLTGPTPEERAYAAMVESLRGAAKSTPK